MFPSQLKLLMLGGALAAAFVAGWLTNGWRLNAKQAKAYKELTVQMELRMTQQAERSRLANERLRLRETELLQQLDTERQAVVILTEEIDNASVVTIRERVPVPENCPAVERCAAIDSVQYRTFYNRAATGTVPDPGVSDSTVP